MIPPWLYFAAYGVITGVVFLGCAAAATARAVSRRLRDRRMAREFAVIASRFSDEEAR